MTSLPVFRDDVQVSVHVEDDQQYLVLNDPFGYATSMVMLSEEMIYVLERCDGQTSYESIAQESGVDADGPEMLRLRAFVGELVQMGYMEGDVYEGLRASVDEAWNALAVRPPVCAESSYPADPGECAAFVRDLLAVPDAPLAPDTAPPPSPHAPVKAVLAPHVDFRVAGSAYGSSFRAVGESDADLFVIVGTTHYWWHDPLILTEKDFETPLGIVRTDVPLVRAIAERLGSLCSASDVAHRPEHSIELHAILLQALRSGRPFTIVPLLVGNLEVVSPAELDRAIQGLREVVDGSGRSAMWLVSGDLSHVGVKFGDPAPDADKLAAVRDKDARLLGYLAAGDIDSWNRHLMQDNSTHVCGFTPVVVGLGAARVQHGAVVAYDIWDQEETSSIVTFAGVEFTGV